MARYVFNPGEPYPYKNIHPLKVEKIRSLLSREAPDIVEKIYLFGSSLDLTCQTESDIDLYFITKEGDLEDGDIIHPFCRRIAGRVDILFNSEEAFDELSKGLNAVEREVLEGGLCIYEKAKSKPSGSRQK